MTIRSVRVIPFAIPLRRPLATAYRTPAVRHGAIVILTDTAGRQGVGEATPHPAAAPHALATMRRDLAGAAHWLGGADAGRLDQLLAETARLGRAAAMGVDMALHDLVARATDRPVSALLGGAVRAVVPASALLVGESDAECAAAARRAAAAGFAVAKLKLGRAGDRALARVVTVRTAAPSLALRCDANGAWTPAAAVAVARRLGRLGIAWLEQPVPADDVEGLARVRRDGGVAVAADEAVRDRVAVARLAGHADVVVLKLVQLGGLAAARTVAADAVRHGLRVTVTTGFETGLATAAALHLAAALPDPLEPCGLATASLLAGDLVAAPAADRPHMSVPERPGLGVDLDVAAVARWRTG